jgi:arginine decarboxylase
MTNIGTTRSSVAYLIEVMVKIAQELDREQEDMGRTEKRLQNRRIASLTNDNPPLPNFSHFHSYFRPDPDGNTREGDLRKAFFMAYKDEQCEYLKLTSLRRQVADGREVVSAMFVIPYPPGFPVLVPGQVINDELMEFMQALDTREIHGYRAELGFRVFTQAALGEVEKTGTSRSRAADSHRVVDSRPIEDSDALHRSPEAT